jgi:hypothetical protein
VGYQYLTVPVQLLGAGKLGTRLCKSSLDCTGAPCYEKKRVIRDRYRYQLGTGVGDGLSFSHIQSSVPKGQNKVTKLKIKMS